MSIPHLAEVRSALVDELMKAGGIGKRQDVIERLAQRFQLTAAEREMKDPSGGRTFDHAVDSAVVGLREVGWMEPPEESGRGIWKLTPDAIENLEGTRTLRVKSAAEATEIAQSFVKKYRAVARPIKAVREGDSWLVELDVGPILVLIGKVKIDAQSGNVLEYDIPST